MGVKADAAFIVRDVFRNLTIVLFVLLAIKILYPALLFGRSLGFFLVGIVVFGIAKVVLE